MKTIVFLCVLCASVVIAAAQTQETERKRTQVPGPGVLSQAEPGQDLSDQVLSYRFRLAPSEHFSIFVSNPSDLPGLFTLRDVKRLLEPGESMVEEINWARSDAVLVKVSRRLQLSLRPRDGVAVPMPKHAAAVVYEVFSAERQGEVTLESPRSRLELVVAGRKASQLLAADASLAEAVQDLRRGAGGRGILVLYSVK
jgi:hypothetical protein